MKAPSGPAEDSSWAQDMGKAERDTACKEDLGQGEAVYSSFGSGLAGLVGEAEGGASEEVEGAVHFASQNCLQAAPWDQRTYHHSLACRR